MRPLKFRARDLANNRWLSPDEYVISPEWDIYLWYMWTIKKYEWNDIEVMQYTWINDDYWNEIYEFDIIECKWTYTSCIKMWEPWIQKEVTRIWLVEWWSYDDWEYCTDWQWYLVWGAFLSDLKNHTYWHTKYDTIKIIGNKFEHPNLLAGIV